jgi:acetyltransferase-like isoleucine patch superfamily enzyme
MAKIAAGLHMASNSEVRRLRAEVAIRDARLHWLRDEPEAAERAMDRALAWKPGHAEAYRTLAEQMFRRERVADAAAAARRAAECRPDAPEYWHFLGMLLVRTGDLAGAVEAQRRAVELDPNHAAARNELERAQIRLANGAQPPAASGALAKPGPTRQVKIALTHAHLEALAGRGLQLEGLLHTRRLAETSRIEAPTAIFAKTTPGAFIDVGAFCSLSGGGSINNARIGRYCSIAGGVRIGAHEHPTDWLTTSRVTYEPHVYGWDTLMAGPGASDIQARKGRFPNPCPITTIGPDVWIGYGAFIRAGVTIGAGAIVAAQATVVRDVPPYTVVGGTPAKIMRLRFLEPIVERLLKLQWWRYSIYELFDAPFSQIEQAVNAIEALAASGAIQPFTGIEVRPADLADPLAFVAADGTRPPTQFNGHTQKEASRCT